MTKYTIVLALLNLIVFCVISCIVGSTSVLSSNYMYAVSNWFDPPVKAYSNTTNTVVYGNNTAVNVSINSSSISLDPVITLRVFNDSYMIGLKLVKVNISYGLISWLNISIYNSVYTANNISIVDNTVLSNETGYILGNNTTLSYNYVFIKGYVEANTSAVIIVDIIYYTPVSASEDQACVIVKYPMIIKIET